ncbi:MAG: M1 family metallopeptidase [Nocardioides sp.]
MRIRELAGWAGVGALLLGGCSVGGDPDTPAPSSPTGSAGARASEGSAVEPDGRALDQAVSEPVEDRLYPNVGDPGVDALHYRLDLAWSPQSRTLDGVETLVFRATEDAERFQLDFGEPLTVSGLTVDGKDTDFREDGKDLVVRTRVVADRRYVVAIRYSGTPETVPAPTTRTDFDSLGWVVTGSDETWTMQEPYGAFTWYAVNDQPSDKALYDFTITTPAPWVGVANGQLLSREDVDGDTVTEWHLDEPASSYLVTVAIGDFRMTKDRSGGGVPLTYWTPRGDVHAARSLRVGGGLLDWLEERLGPYPFSSFGILVVDSLSGIETQTMVTLGNNDYILSPQVILHEMSHQWYGDRVTPRDWRDLWMSEGMATYLQATWESEQGRSMQEQVDSWAALDQEIRDESGPPADYDPSTFGETNVYTSPALMWDQLRKRIGDDLFWELVRRWPEDHDNENAAYDEITAWWSDETGEDLQPFFDDWLLGEETPDLI